MSGQLAHRSYSSRHHSFCVITSYGYFYLHSPCYTANDISAHIILFPACTLCYVWIVNLQLLLVFGIQEPVLHVILQPSLVPVQF